MASIPACHAGDRGSIPRDGIFGDLAQLVARVLSMHKVAGSIPAISILLRVGDKLVAYISSQVWNFSTESVKASMTRINFWQKNRTLDEIDGQIQNLINIGKLLPQSFVAVDNSLSKGLELRQNNRSSMDRWNMENAMASDLQLQEISYGIRVRIM